MRVEQQSDSLQMPLREGVVLFSQFDALFSHVLKVERRRLTAAMTRVELLNALCNIPYGRLHLPVERGLHLFSSARCASSTLRQKTSSCSVPSKAQLACGKSQRQPQRPETQTHLQT